MVCRVLVAVANYPSEDRKLSLAYVHTRNLYYVTKGIDVTVLNFKAENGYTIDGIKVLSLNEYKAHKKEYDILICHAANLRNHYAFLVKHGDDFKKFIFFFHGHEVLMCNHVYPQTYPFAKKHYFKVFFGDLYDRFKLMVWRHYYPQVVYKSWFVFVSNWMLEEFEKWTKIDRKMLLDRYSITYNCIGEPFELAEYDWKSDKEYDFITIRHNLDNSKYGIDIVNNLAKSNPKYKFLVIGKGKFFEHFEKADNVEWLNMTMNHEKIVSFLQKARCALMPTRTDAQGLMMCEMASTGMPLITSDIPVCYESLGDFKNVRMINNENTTLDLSSIFEDIQKGLPYYKNDKYYNAKTSQFEVDLIENVFME